MSHNVDALALFGTAEPPAERRQLRAGRLSAILEDGNLRTIGFDGVEGVRAVNYLARDTSWGTYRAQISNLRIEEGADAFSVSYDALCEGEGRFSYTMRIRGEASGRLVMEAEGEALTEFPTNRLGFVVLHPAETGGKKLTVRHTDGRTEDTAFPEAISADQPVFDIAALTHEPAAGLTCTVTMEGDAFEMEDQRNWSDASFKTYVRPLSKLRPFTIARGTKDRQRIEIAFEGRAGATASSGGAKGALKIGKPIGGMPRIAYFLDLAETSAARSQAANLPRASDVIVRYDPGRDAPAALAKAADFAKAIGAELAVEAVFDARDASGEARAVADAFSAAQVAPSAVLVALRREFKTQPSNTVPAGEVARGEIVAALRRAGLTTKIGGGTQSHFTEFNRNPPTGEEEDFIFFGSAATVHSADDVSVMETISVYPAMIASARKLVPGKPLWLGPATIGMRHNPYGADVAANPDGVRKPMARRDPRHGALFGAAFAVGVAAHAAKAGVDRLTLAAPTGDFGLFGEDGKMRPIGAVVAQLAKAAGAEVVETEVDVAGLAALAFKSRGGTCVLLANLTPEAVEIALPHSARTVELIEADGTAKPSDARAGTLSIDGYRTLIVAL
jgi:hypothetical protein